MNKRNDKITTTKEGEQPTGENYELPESVPAEKEAIVKKERREGVE